MKRNLLNILLLIVPLFIASCSIDPEPINFGKDQCEHCRMTIVDNKFGAEIITKKGKVYKFDATECMINFVKQSKIKNEDVSIYVVVDATKQGQFTGAKQASYLISPNFPSPMGANLSAFGNKSDAESYQKNYQGEVKSWDEILTKLQTK